MTTKTLAERIVLGAGWQEVLEGDLNAPYLEELSQFVRAQRESGVPVYPASHLVFNALCQTPYEAVKVVIVGQDPYHGPGQAHGMCFSVNKGVPIPPSLQNIYKELMADVGTLKPEHGCLQAWANQGVLLLNATLTVREGQPKSHYGKGWERFTDSVIRSLLHRPVVFVLWGSSAKEKVANVMRQDPTAHPVILTAPHPSPLSAHRGFLGCGHFSKINEELTRMGLAPVDWQII